MKTRFRKLKLSSTNRQRLEVVNNIINNYKAQGYKLTLRQLYYQLVSRDLIPNKQAEYNKLSTLLKEGRMAGVVDWDAIEDRLRVPWLPYYVHDTEDALNDTIKEYRLNRQEGQNTYLEVWVEKDALSGVLKRITNKYHVNLLVNRGYGSVTAIHDAYKRISAQIKKGKKTKILYLGDHDPSGIDMIRDIYERIGEMLQWGPACDWETLFENTEDYRRGALLNKWENLGDEHNLSTPDIYRGACVDFAGEELTERFKVKSIALTMEQIKEYNPPPNPAKVTDPRAKDYIRKFGSVSWEVDALEPAVLNQLLSDAIEKEINISLYEGVLEQERHDKKILENLKEHL